MEVLWLCRASRLFGSRRCGLAAGGYGPQGLWRGVVSSHLWVVTLDNEVLAPRAALLFVRLVQVPTLTHFFRGLQRTEGGPRAPRGELRNQLAARSAPHIDLLDFSLFFLLLLLFEALCASEHGLE